MKKLFLSILLAALCGQSGLAQSADDERKVEVFAGFSYAHINSKGNQLLIGENRPGFNASVTGNISRYVGLKFDVSGHYGRNTSNRNAVRIEEKSSTYNFLGGLQFKDNRSEARVKPFAHALIGAVRANGLRGNIVCGAAIGFPCRFPNDSDTGLAAAFGGGVDVRLSKRVDFRVAQVDYNPTRLRNLRLVDARETQHNVRLGVGFVFH